MTLLNKFRLDGSVALITGASKGIGAGISKVFAEAGADLAIAARSKRDLDLVADEIESFGRRALCVPTDVLEKTQLERLISRVEESYGKLDILVNNAGGFPPKAFLDTEVEEFDYAMRFNVSSAFSLSRLAIPLMTKKSSNANGTILNISSVAGGFPAPSFSAYGTAKCALSFLTRALAQELAPKIRVNAIAVGSTKTSSLNAVLTPEIEETMVSLTPLSRLGEVEDVALGALYLSSPASDYVTGQILGVNGGLERLSMEFPRAFGGVG